jgi:hypothetical protein
VQVEVQQRAAGGGRSRDRAKPDQQSPSIVPAAEAAIEPASSAASIVGPYSRSSTIAPGSVPKTSGTG